jgi:hypothetical protein
VKNSEPSKKIRVAVDVLVAGVRSDVVSILLRLDRPEGVMRRRQ